MLHQKVRSTDEALIDEWNICNVLLILLLLVNLIMLADILPLQRGQISE